MSTVLKWILFLLYLACLTVAAIAIALLGSFMCLRDSCIKKATMISKRINSNIDPCKDFYSFTHGHSSDKTLVTDETGNIFSRMEQDVRVYTDTLITGNKFVGKVDHIVVLMRKFNKLCLKGYNAETKGKGAQLSLKNALFSMNLFPEMFEENTWNNLSVGHIEYESRKNGFSGKTIFSSQTVIDPKKKQRYLVIIERAVLKPITPDEVVNFSEDQHTTYKEYFYSLYKRILDRKLDKAVVTKVVELEINIARAIIAAEDRSDKPLITDLDGLDKAVPFIGFKDYFNKALPPEVSRPKRYVLYDKGYFINLKEIFEKTPPYVIATYMIFRNIAEMDFYLPHVKDDESNRFWQNTNASFFISRKEYCENLVKTFFGGGLTSLIIEKFKIKSDGQTVLRSMARVIRQEMKTSIKKSTWMDAETKSHAISKLNAATSSLSVSGIQFKTLSNPKKRLDYYDRLCFQSNVLNAVLCMNKFLNRKNLNPSHGYIVPGFDDDSNKAYMPGINYNQKDCEFVVPTGVLKFPAFDEIWPISVNYGGIGTTIGLELSRGFDSEGSAYDEDGRPNNWWSNETRNNFNKKQIECYRDKSKMKLFQEIGGIQIAYKALLKVLNNIYKDQSLPGLKSYTAKQMFFLSYSSLYYSHRPEYFSKYNKVSNNSEIEALFTYISMSKYFRDAFGCKNDIGSKEKLLEKCILWY